MYFKGLNIATRVRIQVGNHNCIGPRAFLNSAINSWLYSARRARMSSMKATYYMNKRYSPIVAEHGMRVMV